MLARAGDALAQDHLTGPRFRIAVSSSATVRELAAMLAASEVPNIPARGRTITLRNRDGQEILVPAPGTTVTGVLLAVHDEVVLLQSDHDGAPASLSVPRAAIAKLERMAGRRSRARYAGIGALLGFGVGGLAGLASASCEPNEFFCSTGLAALGGAGFGAIVGAVAGAIIPPAARWIPIDDASLAGALRPLEQPAVPPQPPRFRRFAVSGQTGQPSSGPAPDVEAAMRAAGFSDLSAGFLGPPTDYPFSRTGFWEIGRPLAFEVHYAWTPSWSIGFVQSHTPIGETFGYRSPGQYLDLQYQVTTTGLVLSRNYRFLRFGGGPALHKAQMRKDPAPEPDPAARNRSWASDSHFGLIGMAGIRLPTETRVHLDLNLQYRYLGSARFGPFTPSCCGSPATTLPAFQSQYSHWFLAFGPGVRF